MFYLPLYITIFSAIGIIVLFWKQFSFIKNISHEELADKLKNSKPLFYDINAKIISPVANYAYTILAPKIYKEFEIIISKIRIFLLKIERVLLHLTHYIRGKREITNSGNNHPYWNVVSEVKKENKDNDNASTPA